MVEHAGEIQRTRETVCLAGMLDELNEGFVEHEFASGKRIRRELFAETISNYIKLHGFSRELFLQRRLLWIIAFEWQTDRQFLDERARKAGMLLPPLEDQTHEVVSDNPDRPI